jgi:hypothetical protein
VTVTAVGLVTDPTETEKAPLAAPAGIVMVLEPRVAAVLSVERVTATPPAPAGTSSTTVPTTESPLATASGLNRTAFGAFGFNASVFE